MVEACQSSLNHLKALGLLANTNYITRLHLVRGDTYNIAMRIMQLLWSADASVNVCPSIHCQSSACMALAFSSSTLTEKRPGLKVLAWVWAALICASTVFTKQHSIVDVVCGLAVAFVWVPVLYRPHRKNS